MLNKFFYFFENLFKSMNRFQVTPYRESKSCVPICGNCGQIIKNAKVKLLNSNKQYLPKIRLSLKEGSQKHKGVHVLPQILNFDILADNYNREVYCKNCLSSFNNCLVLKIADINILVYL